MRRRHGGENGEGCPLCGQLHQSQSRHPSDRHLGRTTGKEMRGAEEGGRGGVMRPQGSVIRLVVERKMTALRTEERQFLVGERPQPPIPLGLHGDWWDMSVC